jgi:hypothetical protein
MSRSRREGVKLVSSIGRLTRFVGLVALALVLTSGCNGKDSDQESVSPGVVIGQAGLTPLYEEVTAAIESAPARVMSGSGLVGAMGGARVKLLKGGTHEVLLPLPQMTATQIPVVYFVATSPGEAGVEYHLRQRDDSNVVVEVRLAGSADQEIKVNWTSVILLVEGSGALDSDPPEPYVRETSCVQSGAEEVVKVADTLWPADGGSAAFALNIQRFIGTMQQASQPQSMDARGILKSGANWICTANANLAAALLRARGIPARSLAVIPVTSQRLEMHRLVEYYDMGRWHTFDPSSLQGGIPLELWRNVVMAKTTITDEDMAMKPRMGVSVGCPYGQELELLDSGVTLWGTDFFWTVAKPLAEFEASSEAIDLARREWERYLATGNLSEGQTRAASARDAGSFLNGLKPE